MNQPAQELHLGGYAPLMWKRERLSLDFWKFWAGKTDLEPRLVVHAVVDLRGVRGRSTR